MTSIDTNKEVETIVYEIESGAMNWINAGKMISKLRDADKEAYTKLISMRPWITPALLHTLERIGCGEVYPYAMLERSEVAKSQPTI